VSRSGENRPTPKNSRKNYDQLIDESSSASFAAARIGARKVASAFRSLMAHSRANQRSRELGHEMRPAHRLRSVRPNHLPPHRSARRAASPSRRARDRRSRPAVIPSPSKDGGKPNCCGPNGEKMDNPTGGIADKRNKSRRCHLVGRSNYFGHHSPQPPTAPPFVAPSIRPVARCLDAFNPDIGIRGSVRWLELLTFDLSRKKSFKSRAAHLPRS
jgi:hypothetical protein